MRIVFFLYEFTIFHVILSMKKDQINIERINFSLLFEEPEQVKKHIIYKLVNKERNLKLLENVPHIDYLDLSIVFYYLTQIGEDEYKGFMISDEHMLMWGLEVSDLMEAASINTKEILGIKVQGIFTTIAEILGEDNLVQAAKEEDILNPLQVMTNRLEKYGAAVILYKDLIEEMAEKFNGDLYIIPCSVHEVLFFRAMKNCQIEIDEIKDMIHYVNRNEIKECDVLSDNLYYYSQETKALSIL